MTDRHETRDEDWSAWFERLAPTLILLARQRDPGSSHADAEDAVHDGFVRFWRARRRQRVRHPEAFLFGCVRRAAMDRRRRDARRRDRERRAGADTPSDAGMFDSPAEQRERDDTIQRALSRLNVEQREVLVMKVWGELTFAELAEALSIPQGTAATRYRTALAKLRDELDGKV